MDKTIKDPKIIAAVIAGFLVPKITSYLGGLLKDAITDRKANKRIYVGVQLGGTNYNIAFGQPQLDLKGKVIGFTLTKQTSGRTSDNPQETLNEIIHYIKSALQENEKCYFVGIASFGPLQLDKKQQNYGSITSTPKPGWKNMSLYKYFSENLPTENLSIETDVNAAAFAEFEQGNHKVQQSLVYVTVGTGVGVGIVSHKKTVHGLTHPEGGHIIINRHSEEYEQFKGTCPFHDNCLEGLTSNRSIAKRLDKEYTKLHELDDGEKIWDLIGYYLAQLCLNITLTVSPEVIVIGGGVMNRKIVFKYIHRYFLELLNKYIEHPLFTSQNIHSYIKPPALGMNVGLKGALLLKFL